MREHIIINAEKRIFSCGELRLPCRIGKAGAIPMRDGREGDAKTPLGDYRLRFGFYRADRLPKPRSKLNFRALSPEDGWCDDPNDPAYNRYIRLPSQASHEKLWRDDGAYDIILVMSQNDSPPQGYNNGPALGSAVFIHIAQPDDRKTLGCIALAPEEMVQILPKLDKGVTIRII